MIKKFLVKYIIYIHNMVNQLSIPLVRENYVYSCHLSISKKEYKKLPVDKLPLFKIPEKLHYKVLLHNYFKSHNKELKPVKQHENKTVIPKEVKCPKCSTPHQHLYDNNGGRGQCLCKVCVIHSI